MAERRIFVGGRGKLLALRRCSILHDRGGSCVVGRLIIISLAQPFDDDAVVAYGQIRTALESQGLPIGALDTLIAAQAVSHNLTLVTNNVREFARVAALNIEDWTQL